MEPTLDNLRRLIESLKEISILERIFSWGKIRNQLVDANGDLQRIASTTSELSSVNSRLENQLSVEQANFQNLREINQRENIANAALKEAHQNLAKQNEALQQQVATLTEQNRNYYSRGTEIARELDLYKQRLQRSESDTSEANAQLVQLRNTDEIRKKEHSNIISSLKEIQEGVQRARDEELREQNRKEVERLMKLKETWINHEDRVKNRIKIIASKHAIDYLEKVPFKGKPDNTLRINDEYIIFDAKSPANDDLSNFPVYIKSQVEAAIKYVREEGVRREVFLVVPTNTLEQIEHFEYRLADYTVFIISLDALEPIILALRRIEDYEFAEQLSPEERENICRIIGKFVHLSKRRIQIDGFFAKQFFELVYRSEADLPKEVLDVVIEFEKAEKLNPPLERRSKQISTKELENDANNLNSEANQRGIVTQQALISKELNKLPLYTEITDSKDDNQPSLFDK